MGMFHCPIGAIGCGGDGCIQCGLCTAVTRAEKQAATEIMRKWIQENAHLRNADIQIRKIAVCGKGGAGKSTITALLAGALDLLGYQILVMDTDSSNGGLWRKLGMAGPALPLSNTAEEDPARLAFLQKEPLYFSEIDDDFIQRNGSRWLVSAGKIDDPLLGCACTIGSYARLLIQNLTPMRRELVLTDQEAGVESFGRGIEQSCDTVLIPVEPSAESIELAQKIQYMAEGIGIRRIRAILNKIEDEEQEEYIRQELSDRGVRYLGTLPLLKDIRSNNLFGKELTPEFSYRMAGTIARFLLDEAEMDYDKVTLPDAGPYPG